MLKSELNKHIDKYNACDKYILINQKYKKDYESFYYLYLTYPTMAIEKYLNKYPELHKSIKMTHLTNTTIQDLTTPKNIIRFTIYLLCLILMRVSFSYMNKKTSSPPKDTVFIQRLSMTLIAIYLTAMYIASVYLVPQSALLHYIFIELIILICPIFAFNLFHLSKTARLLYSNNGLYPSILFLSIAFNIFAYTIRHVPIESFTPGELYSLIKILKFILAGLIMMCVITLYKIIQVLQSRFQFKYGKPILFLYVIAIAYIVIKCGLNFNILTSFVSSLILKLPPILAFLSIYFSIFNFCNNIASVDRAGVKKFCQYLNIKKNNKLHEFYIINYLLGFLVVFVTIIQVSGGKFLEVLLSNYNFNGVLINPTSFYSSLAVFFLTITIFRVLAGMMFLNTEPLDQAHSKTRAFRYKLSITFGLFVATFFALWVAKISLTGIFIVLGALSVGIGIGLKNIINNLISGIILIFEKPIHVGDYICIGNHEGLVTKINLRSTQIKTLANFHMLIPNELVLTEIVTNYHVDNTSISIPITFEISRNENIEKMKKIVNEVMSKQPDLILEDSEGNSKVFILIKNISPYGLRIKVFVDIDVAIKKYRVTSAIYQDLIERFAKEGIVIPKPPIVALPNK